MTTGLTRASLFGIKKETTIGDYQKATSLVALRPGNELSYEPEALENDELLNDIGAAKSAVGKEVAKGKHAAYLRHSGVEGQEPQLGLMYESILGSKFIVGTQQVTIAGSTTTVLNVGVGLGVQFRVGQALLIKDGLNGYSIRNVKAINGDQLTLNFKINTPPGAGVGLGKAIVYIPAAQGHPNFSTTKWLGNGHAIEASAGNTATDFSLKAAANGYGEVEFSYEGTKYLFNPMIVTALNKYLDITDDGGTIAVPVLENTYKTPIDLASAIESAINAVSTKVYTVKFDKTSGKFTISSTSTLLTLKWQSGAHSANSIGSLLGFVVTADDSGATSYTSDNEQDYSCSITPAYDSGELIVMKGAEVFVGDVDDNLCICAQEVGVSIKKDTEDEDCMCEESGVASKIPTGRACEITIKATMKKHDVTLLDALLKNKTIAAMINAGHKNAGNWIGGQCANFYSQSCTVSKYTTTGDSFLQVDMTLKGFVSSTTKDLFVNFV